MLLPPPFVRYIARYLARRLGTESCQVKNPRAVEDAFDKVIVDDLSIEDEINLEARELLGQYADYMRENEIPFHEMFSRVKRGILEERKYIQAAAKQGSGNRSAKLSREKINDLSHKLAAQLPRIEGVRVLKGWNAARLEIGELLNKVLSMEEQIDIKARRTIESQKRDIVEGSQEWSALHRRYYEEEMRRIGVDLSMPEVPTA